MFVRNVDVYLRVYHVAEWLTLLLRIWEVQGSYVGPESDYAD
jgi:hypothetical protein